MKLQTKVFLLLAPLLIALITPLVWSTYTELQRTSQERLLVEMDSALVRLEAKLTEFFKQFARNTTLLARSEVLKPFLDNPSTSARTLLYRTALRELDRYQDTFPEYAEIRVYAANGVEQLRSIGSPLSLDDRYYDALVSQKRRRGGSKMLSVVHSDKKYHPILQAILPITGDNTTWNVNPEDSAILGYVIISAKLTFMEQHISTHAILNDGFLFITDRRGALLAQPNHSSLSNGVLEAAVSDYKSAQTRQAIRLPYSGKMTYLQGRPLNRHLTLFALLPETTVQQKTQAYGRMIIATTAISLIIVLGIVLAALKRFLINPVRKISTAAQHISAGNTVPVLDINNSDELGDLAQSLRSLGDNLRRHNDQIRFYAYHDSLTKLPNRMMFCEYLRRAIAHAKRNGQSLAVLFLDLDNFKRINDTLGHQAGDQVLLQVAERLNECIREDDYVARSDSKTESATVARLGGDEFTMLLTDIKTPYEAAKVASRVLQSLSKPLRQGTHALPVVASIGITLFPKDGTDYETLIKNADMAMYHAKETGKNRYKYFRDSMNIKAIERLELETELRRALKNDEFVLLYQPQLNLTTGRIEAIEALVRWLHPEKGVILPDTFIPFAEESGLIVPLGEWVTEQACLQNKRWHDYGFGDLTISVNISASQFNHHDLTASVRQALDKSGLAPEYLEIELTESTVIHAENRISDMLDCLKELGIQIAMDDFGTGYSSLSCLRRLPIDKIKIDRSFVQGINSEHGDKAILAAILSMADHLTLPVTAEGVENQTQVDFLRDHGCLMIQGNRISKPVPADKLTELLRERQAPPAQQPEPAYSKAV